MQAALLSELCCAYTAVHGGRMLRDFISAGRVLCDEDEAGDTKITDHTHAQLVEARAFAAAFAGLPSSSS